MNNPKSVLAVSCLLFIIFQFTILNDAYSEVTWDGGGSLPHPNGQGGSGNNGGNNNGQGDPGNNGGNNNGNHSNQPKPDGTPYPGYPNVVWAGNGLIRPADGYGWKTPANPGASNYEVVPLTTKAKIERILPDTVRALKDKKIRAWVDNVDWKFSDRPQDQNQLSPWVGDSCLIFTKSFLTETEAMRENLIAFESGKLFFTMMKDKPVKGGKTMEMWFVDYSARYYSTIWNMKKTKHKEEDLSLLGDIDKESQFGYIFRAQALQLNKPKEQEAQQEWDKAIREFQKYISPLLRTKQR